MKEKSEKAGLKFNIQKTNTMASCPITSWQIDGETMETVADFIFWVSKITADVTAAMRLKDTCSKKKKKRQLLLGKKSMINIDSI